MSFKGFINSIIDFLIGVRDPAVVQRPVVEKRRYSVKNATFDLRRNGVAVLVDGEFEVDEDGNPFIWRSGSPPITLAGGDRVRVWGGNHLDQATVVINGVPVNNLFPNRTWYEGIIHPDEWNLLAGRDVTQ